MYIDYDSVHLLFCVFFPFDFKHVPLFVCLLTLLSFSTTWLAQWLALEESVLPGWHICSL